MTTQEMVTEIKKAVDRGPVYVLVFAGAILLLGVDPTEFVVTPSHLLSAPEFITVNIVAGALVIIAGIISLFAARTAMQTVRAISVASSEAAIKTIEGYTALAQRVSGDQAVLQNQLAGNITEIYKNLTGTQPNATNSPVTTASPP